MNKSLSFSLVLCVACHACRRSLRSPKLGQGNEMKVKAGDEIKGGRSREKSKYGSSGHLAYLVSVYRVLLLQLALSESLVVLLKLL